MADAAAVQARALAEIRLLTHLGKVSQLAGRGNIPAARMVMDDAMSDLDDIQAAINGEDPYRACFECKHEFTTAAELLAAHNQHLSRYGREPETDPERVETCPACLHSF